MANKPMNIKAIPGYKMFFKVTHKNQFICLIHSACDNGPEGMDRDGQWNGRMVWVHANQAGYAVPNRIAFNSFQSAYAWACDTEGIVPLF
jgi:hypothetical protein